MKDRVDKAFAWFLQDFPPATRAVAKWYFDLIKNAFVVVALMFTLRKTGGVTIKVITGLTIAAFIMYTLSYTITAYSVIHNYGQSRSPLLSLLITMLGGVILLVFMAAVALAVFEVILALFSAQLVK